MYIAIALINALISGVEGRFVHDHTEHQVHAH
jgi:hypothetical protein